MAMKYPEDRVKPVWQLSEGGVLYQSFIGHDDVDPETMFDTEDEAKEYGDEKGISVKSTHPIEGLDVEESGGDDPNLFTDDEVREKVVASFDELEEGDFRQDGVPKVGPVRDKSGVTGLTSDELEALWAEYAPG